MFKSFSKFNKLKVKKEWFLLLAMFLLFILIRSIHFQAHLNFSTDQATFSSKALEIYKERLLVLLGPRFSLEYDGRFMFQGPVIYYFMLLFLLPSNFDPVWASYLFVIFSALMIIPLYFGLKTLINRNVAILAVAIYAFFPVSVNYTRFLWNPNFQYSLLPLLVFLIARFNKRKNGLNFFLTSFFSGLLLQFHYFFIVILLALATYYFVFLKLKSNYILIFLLGLILGNLPIIIFELRNNFYNLNTLVLVLTHLKEIVQSRGEGGGMYPHYFLSISFFFFILIFYLFKKYIKSKIVFITTAVLFLIALGVYGPLPSKVYGMADNWSYPDELKVHGIVSAQNKQSFSANKQNFNIANLAYDPKAQVQKYLLKRDDTIINEDDYKSNKYLYVISSKEFVLKDHAYEITSILPAKIIKKWKINDVYDLFLLERI